MQSVFLHCDNASENLIFKKLKLLLTFESTEKKYCHSKERIDVKQYFPEVLFIVRYKEVSSFESADKPLT